MTLEATVSMGWVNTVVDAAQRLGVKKEALLMTAGISPQALGWERWPIDYITRLWHSAERCTEDSGFGLKVGTGVRPASIDIVSFALQSAATLREAMSLVQKYQRLISDGGRFQMLPGIRGTWIVYHPRQGRLAFSPHQLEAVLSAVVTLSGWLSGKRLNVLRVQFSHSRLGRQTGYHDVFGCPVEFEQAFSGLLVTNEDLDEPLPNIDMRLAKVHEQYSENRLAALDGGKVSAQSLRRWLLTQLSQTLPKRADAARALGISQRTLARRLQAQGQTFNGLLDDVRREWALQAVAEGEQSLADIAQSLGYAEASTFYRAFHRWTSMPPARWRKYNAGK